ncbi:hypothetical protein, partial [Streptomyces tendae]
MSQERRKLPLIAVYGEAAAKAEQPHAPDLPARRTRQKTVEDQGRGAMLNPAGADGVPTGATPVPGPVDDVAAIRPTSPAEQVLADFLKAHLALQHHLGFDGTAGWKHRSVYDLVAVHGRWSTPAPPPGRGVAA